jgi:hypothetical protein
MEAASWNLNDSESSMTAPPAGKHQQAGQFRHRIGDSNVLRSISQLTQSSGFFQPETERTS